MSLIEAKKSLAESIALYKHLKSAVENEVGLHEYSDEQWRDHIRNLGLDTAKLLQISRLADDEEYLEKLRRKQKKLARHREWRKRHSKRTRRQRQESRKRGEQWKEDIVWQVTTTPSVIAQQLSQQQQQQASKEKVSTEKNTKEDIKKLSRLLSKLTKLRSLRRKKLEAKGHFYADEGSHFYNQVKEWHEREQLEQQQRENQQMDEEKETKWDDDEKRKDKQKQLYVHPQDTWNSMPIDEIAYKYWCEAEQSLNSLLLTRKLWDQYILFDTGESNDDEDRLHKVPPTLVSPSPPANWVWATYLQS